MKVRGEKGGGRRSLRDIDTPNEWAHLREPSLLERKFKITFHYPYSPPANAYFSAPPRTKLLRRIVSTPSPSISSSIYSVCSYHSLRANPIKAPVMTSITKSSEFFPHSTLCGLSKADPCLPWKAPPLALLISSSFTSCHFSVSLAIFSFFNAKCGSADQYHLGTQEKCRFLDFISNY